VSQSSVVKPGHVPGVDNTKVASENETAIPFCCRVKDVETTQNCVYS
jgi:hypothetical protein